MKKAREQNISVLAARQESVLDVLHRNESPSRSEMTTHINLQVLDTSMLNVSTNEKFV